MKTSNKILCTAGAAFLLVQLGMAIFVHQRYNQTKAYPQALLQQLSTTRIRTLIVKSSEMSVWQDKIHILPKHPEVKMQYINFPSLPTPETIFIHGDTLELHNVQKQVNLQLPFMESNNLGQPPLS